jgi:hypothetical protein
MINWRQKADLLLKEFALCHQAYSKNQAIELQLEKDRVATLAHQLNMQRLWGANKDIASACLALEPQLEKLKCRLIMDLLTNGTI